MWNFRTFLNILEVISLYYFPYFIICPRFSGFQESILIYVQKYCKIVYYFIWDRCVVMPSKLISRITNQYFPCYLIIVPFALLTHSKVNICANCIRAWQYLDEILLLRWDECVTIKNLNCFCNRAWNQKRSINKHLTKSCHDGE